MLIQVLLQHWFTSALDFDQPQRVSLCVQHKLIQRNHITGRKQEVKVLQRLRKKEALLRVVMYRRHCPHGPEASVARLYLQ